MEKCYKFDYCLLIYFAGIRRLRPVSNGMKVILLKDVPKLGQRYDIKDVSDGYALNMLIPRGLVKKATAEAIKEVEMKKSNDLTHKKIEEELLLKNLEILKDTTVTISGKANEQKHLFAGITKETLSKELEKSSRIKINPEFIDLEKPIKELGGHKIKVVIGNKRGEFNLNVTAD